MSELTFEWDERYHQGILVGDYVSEIREIFSTPNDAARFARMRGRYAPSRNYVITPAGRFDIGLGNKIEQILLNEFPDLHITKTKDYKKYIEPTYGNPTIPKLNLELRDYQHQTVTKCLDAGRGVVSLATAGGKTLIIAALLEAIFKAKKKQASMLVIVPDRGLVNQTFNDFKDYGVTFTYSKWTGDNDLDISTNVIIANLGILQSTKSDTDWIEHIDCVIVDEVHKLRRKNKVNKLIKKIHTPTPKVIFLLLIP